MEMTNEAKTARRAYFRSWNQAHPENVKAHNLKKWETKAKNLYGDYYQPPSKDGELSDQARQIRNDYYKEYRRTHPENVNEAITKFWHRKACQGKD